MCMHQLNIKCPYKHFLNELQESLKKNELQENRVMVKTFYD